MQFRFSLTLKVLALVTLPLIFELACIGVLAKFASDAEKEAEQAEHYRLISDEISAIVFSMFKVSHSTIEWRAHVKNDPNGAALSAAPAMIKHVDNLIEATKTDPEYHAAALRLKNLFGRARNTWNEGVHDLAAGDIEAYKTRTRLLRVIKFESYRTMSDDLIDLARKSASKRAEAHERGVLSRQQFKQVLFTMVAGNIVLFSILAFMLTRRVTMRLSILADNAARVARGQPLNVPDRGADEIGDVDSSFHAMAKALESAERGRQDLIAMVTHDLRTPLTAMINICEMLQNEGPLPDGAVAMLKRADIAGSRMIFLINDFLNMDKIRHGQLTLSPSLVLIDELFQLCCETTSAIADEKSVMLVCESAEWEIFVDAERILQVLINLVCNAIKYSQPGGKVLISALRCDDNGGEVEIRIRDFGRGIPKDMLEEIFERYQQVEESDATVKGGSGLGLSICKYIVELHGGKIWAISEPAEGSTFFFRLPLHERSKMTTGM